MNLIKMFTKSVLFALIVGVILPSCKDDDDGTTPDTQLEDAQKAFADYFTTAGNKVKDPAFTAGSVIPTATFEGFSTAPAGMTTTNYKGAIDPSAGQTWYADWSFYSNIVGGNLNSDALPTNPIKTLASGPTGTVTWSKDTTYILDGRVWVESGATLTIEAGTVIKGKAGEGTAASVLIVSRGATIMANGTSSEPIVFTAEADNGGSPATTRGLWGGVIILGSAGLNSNPGETSVEGIPTNVDYGKYGGSDDADNSGVFRYVSIRHGGKEIGQGNEINGLTLGGVGSGTTLEYVEVIANKDDGIEWFGGTVNGRYLISAFCQDDGLDYDEGYRGSNQFVIVHQEEGDADRGGEHDGGTDPEDGTPYATPMFYNVTSVGSSSSRALTFRDNAGGEYHNSIFVNYGKGIDIELLLDQEQHSYAMFSDDLMKAENNVFFNIGDGTTGEDLFTISTP